MKRMGLVAVCILSLLSCSKDDSTDSAQPTRQIHYTLASKAQGEAELMNKTPELIRNIITTLQQKYPLK